MHTPLAWQGPFGFTSRHAHALLSAPVSAATGLYFWVIRTADGPRAHYVGETGASFAARHVEHFHAYASGVYNTRDADALVSGDDIILSRGALWRRRTPEAVQPFIDNFELFARHTARTLELIDIYVAPCDGSQRLRRRLEGGLVKALYDAAPEVRRLFPPGYRVWARRAEEVPIHVACETPPDVPGFPARFEA